MKSNALYNFIREAVVTVPKVIQYLSPRTRWIIAIKSGDGTKSYDYYLTSLQDLITRTYNGALGTVAFTDALASLISGQMRNAYNTAWYDLEFGGAESAEFPDYLEASLMDTVNTQQNMNYIYQFYNDIRAAAIREAGLNGLLSRAELWATRWTEAYNEATTVITMQSGGKLVWVEGDTEEKCPTCLALDGIVALASTWDKLGVKPQRAPNGKLKCGGWKCECELQPTTRRLSPNAKDRIRKALRAK